jgi:EAL domain-containing protein (putative c-di-GMP-specific phosphodiesterase class I)
MLLTYAIYPRGRLNGKTKRAVAMSIGCQGCRDGAGFTVPFSMAFQPIVDIVSGTTFAHEALVRGPNGEGAFTVLSAVDETNRYAFDQQCRVRAIELAAKLDLAADGTHLSINFMPSAVYEPRACIRLTLDAAKRTGFPLDRIIFEFTETEKLDTAHLLNILKTYKAIGFKTAIDDFGAGYAGLQLLAQFQPDIVKIDMDLVRGIDASPVKRSILRHTLRLLEELAITPLCEGVETNDELMALQDLGVRLIQGYLLAKPTFERLAVPVVPEWRLPQAAE